MWSIQIRSAINDLAFPTHPAATQHSTCCQAFASETQASSNHTGTAMNQAEVNYKAILSKVSNADGLANEVGQLRAEIWKLCLQLAEYDFQPGDDPDFSYWSTTVERDGTTYNIVLAFNDQEPPFLWEVQVNGSNIFDVLSNDVKESFEYIAYQEMERIGDEI